MRLTCLHEQLISVSLGTIACLILAILLYNFTNLSHIFDLILNGAISFFWLLGLGSLTWSVSNILGRQCDRKSWGTSSGVRVCTEYKILWAFALLATLSSLAALGLDFYTKNKASKHKTYIIPTDDKRTMQLAELHRHSATPRPELPMEQRSDSSPSPFKDDEIAYHHGYGIRDNGSPSPLGFPAYSHQANNMGYHNRYFPNSPESPLSILNRDRGLYI